MPPAPLIFALAMEPVALEVRQDRIMEGFRRRYREERIALYADDVLIFLGDTERSLRQAMDIFSRFGKLSDLSINWGKSALLPLDTIRKSSCLESIQVKIIEKTKYLGIYITNDPNDYINNNLVPLLAKFKNKSDIWKGLPLSVVGRCNLIKMLWLPQLLYLMHNSPIWIQRKWFKKIDTLLRALIWKGGQPRKSLQILQLPTQDGGLAVPHPRSYF